MLKVGANQTKVIFFFTEERQPADNRLQGHSEVKTDARTESWGSPEVNFTLRELFTDREIGSSAHFNIF